MDTQTSNINKDDEENPTAVLRRRMDFILKYKESKKIKDNVISKNFKYFINK